MPLIEIVDQYGNPTGELATREECFQKGLLKRCSWIVFFSKNRGILFQKRSITKKLFPNVWDFTAAGHIDPGETPVIAALREIHEEIGLVLDENTLVFQAMFANKNTLPDGDINNELGYLYFVDWTGKEENFLLQTEEVEALKWISIHDLEKTFFQDEWPEDFVPHRNVFRYILIAVRELL